MAVQLPNGARPRSNAGTNRKFCAKVPRRPTKSKTQWPAVATRRQGDGRLPHHADFAVLTMQERVVDGRRLAVGDVVGWLGWQLQVTPDQVAIIGYPGNLDRGERMQQTHAGLFRAVPPSDIEFGSAQGGGSSGGPII